MHEFRRAESRLATPRNVARHSPTITRRITAASRPVVLPLLVLALAASCRATAPGFGPSRTTAARHADDFFGALSARFTRVRRAPRFALARGKLGKNALTPSKIFGDTSIWTSAPAPAVRVVTLAGTADLANGYLFAPVSSAGFPARPGDSRHVMQLARVQDDTFGWTSTVEHAIGGMAAADFSTMLAATIASVAGRGRTEAAVRADYRSAFPRTAAHMAGLFSLDTLRLVPDGTGANRVTLGIALHPDRLRARGYPAFAQYVEKYVRPSRYRIVLRDRRGARWLEASARDDFLTLQFRARPDGRLGALDGAAATMPDTLQLDVELFVKVLLFDVGVSKLSGDMTMLRGAHERGFAVRFHREPEWHLPLASRYFLKSPLRRPFQGEGITTRVAVRDSAGAQTLIARRTTATVQESAILRWLGALSGTAMNDFAGKSEAEENRFNAELFAAMQADTRALLR